MKLPESVLLDIPNRYTAIAGLARALTKSGDTTDALDIAHSCEEGSYRDSAFAIIASELALSGRLAEALGVAGQVSKDSQPKAFADIVEATVASGQLDEALKIAAKIQQPTTRSRSLVNVADGLTRIGRRCDAKKALDIALDDARQISLFERDTCLIDVADAKIRAGETADAEIIIEAADVAARKMDEGGDARSDALSRIVESWIRSGRLDAALKEMIASGLRDAAFAAARRIEDRNYKSWGLLKGVAELIRSGQVRAALETAGKLEDHSDRARALVEVPASLAKAGQREQAAKVLDDSLQAASRVDDVYRRSSVLARVAWLLAGSSRFHSARRISQGCLTVDRLQAYKSILSIYKKITVAPEASVRTDSTSLSSKHRFIVLH